MISKIKQLFKNQSKSEFTRNVSKLTSATAIAQLISIGTAPILYRIYDKEAYGTLGLYMAITSILGVFSTLQYLQVIMLEKEDEDAINAMWLNRFINTGFAILVGLAIVLFFSLFVSWADNPALSKWFWMIPVGIFFAGQNEIFRIWANRKKEYNLLTFNGIFMAILTPVISISLGFWIQNETGLLVGLLVGQSLPALILLIGLVNKYEIGFSKLNLRTLKTLFFKHQNFPLYALPSEFVHRFSNQLPVFMLNHFVGTGAVGVYNLAMRMLGLPINFIGGAISTVFQQRASEDFHQTGSCRAIFVKTLKSLSLISVAPTVMILFFGPQLFGFAFGEKWQEAGIYAQLLILMMMLKLIISPLTYTFFIVGKLKLDFIYHIGILLSTTFVLWMGFKFLNIKMGLLFFGLSHSIWYVFYLYKSYQYSNGL